jgi:hypothetical protein
VARRRRSGFVGLAAHEGRVVHTSGPSVSLDQELAFQEGRQPWMFISLVALDRLAVFLRRMWMI